MSRFSYLVRLHRFVLAGNPLYAPTLVLALGSAALEVYAMTFLIPLANIAGGKASRLGDGHVATLLERLGLPPSAQAALALFLALLIVRTLSQLAGQALMQRLGRLVQAQIASQGLRNVVTSFSLREIDMRTPGYFISLAGDEAWRASGMVTSLMQLAVSGALAVLYFAAILRFSPEAAFAILIFLLVSFVSLLQAFRKSHLLGERMVGESRSLNSVFLDAISGLRSVRAFRAEEFVSANYRAQIFQYARTLFHIDFLNLLARLAPVALLLFVCLIAFVAFKPAEDPVDFAFAFTVVIFLMRFFPAVGSCLNTMLRLVSDMKAAKDVTEILRAPDVRESASKRTLSTPVESIEMRRVVFSHDARHPLFQDFDFRFLRGVSYAIYGASGSGKSTLADLLLNFYEAQSGDISVNGMLIRDIAETSLRKHIVLLGQQVSLFNDTVANNVAFGQPMSREEIRAACRLACVDDVICGMTHGYDTVLQYQGANLSGGQRQRIGLARALARRSDVLILDESTNALDEDLRGRVVQNILDMYRERIVIFITHDAQIADLVNDVVLLPQFPARI